MNSTILKASALPPETLAAWANLHQSNPTLASPYFAPAFTQIVAAARGDVEVAVVVEDGRIVAIFPYQRRKFNIGGPVGEFISDYQGLICAPEFRLQPRELLRACGLVAYDYNHLLAAQTCFNPFHKEHHRSPIINLTAGYEAYAKERREAGSEQIKKTGNLMRRLEREVGTLRFVAHSPDKKVLEELMVWKTNQYRQNGWRDLFSIPWVRKTIEAIHSTQSADFAGMLSVLYAGDRMVAAHFGMRSATVWHYWFPAYDAAFSMYSPGLILLLRMAQGATAHGVKIIDMGCGEHSYKSRLMNGFVPTSKGSVELPCLTTAARRVLTPVGKARFRVRCWMGKTPMGALARRVRDRIGQQSAAPANFL